MVDGGKISVVLIFQVQSPWEEAHKRYLWGTLLVESVGQLDPSEMILTGGGNKEGSYALLIYAFSAHQLLNFNMSVDYLFFTSSMYGLRRALNIHFSLNQSTIDPTMFKLHLRCKREFERTTDGLGIYAIRPWHPHPSLLIWIVFPTLGRYLCNTEAIKRLASVIGTPLQGELVRVQCRVAVEKVVVVVDASFTYPDKVSLRIESGKEVRNVDIKVTHAKCMDESSGGGGVGFR